MGRALLALFALSCAAGCVRPGAYHCNTNSQCLFEGMQGVCEGIGFCSFPDGSCDDGFRYGAHAGPLANQCVTDDNSGLVSIGGRVDGLMGGGLVLRNNGMDDLTITLDGPFTFPSELMGGVPYEVTVASQPSEPEQTCVVNNASGVTEVVDINDVEVTCSTRAFIVGGTVYGLTGSGLMLSNGSDSVAVSASGPFMFPMQIPSGAPYSVAIASQPSGQTCTVSGATGTIGAGNISTVVINCDAGRFTVGGSVTGIDGTVIIKNNNTDTATVTSNGTFAFPMPLTPGANYDVAVFQQPLYPPRNQTCIITNGSGSMPSANVTDISINCTTNTFSVGGNIIGLAGTMMLQNNGGDTLTINTTGNFTFPTRISSGGTYAVSLVSAPAGQTCAISGSPAGVVANANITSIVITCGDKTDPGILCGTFYCDPEIEMCCIDNGTPICSTSCTGSGAVPVRCDTQADCSAQGQPASVCCGNISSFEISNVYCTAADHCHSPKVYFCDPNLVNPCPDGGSCQPTSQPFPGWFKCF